MISYKSSRFSSMNQFKLIFVYNVKNRDFFFVYFVYNYPIVLAPLVENGFFSFPLNCLDNFVKNKLNIHIGPNSRFSILLPIDLFF